MWRLRLNLGFISWFLGHGVIFLKTHYSWFPMCFVSYGKAAAPSGVLKPFLCLWWVSGSWWWFSVQCPFYKKRSVDSSQPLDDFTFLWKMFFVSLWYFSTYLPTYRLSVFGLKSRLLFIVYVFFLLSVSPLSLAFGEKSVRSCLSDQGTCVCVSSQCFLCASPHS